MNPFKKQSSNQADKQSNKLTKSLDIAKRFPHLLIIKKLRIYLKSLNIIDFLLKY